MTKRAFTFLAVSALAVVAAVPLMAQTVNLTSNVPFEFTVSGKTMPAGEYSIANDSAATVVRLNNFEAHTAVMAMANRDSNGPLVWSGGDSKLVFNRYGDRYFLSEVVIGYNGNALSLPPSSTERELAKTASLRQETVVMLLARR